MDVYNTEPAHNWFEVTPHDTNPQDPFKSLYVGVAGDVVVVSDEGDEATFTCADGAILPIAGQAVVIKSTGTDATGLVAFRPTPAKQMIS